MANPAQPARISWPKWAKILASAAVIWQIGSVVAAELTSGPSSPLEQQVAHLFERHHQLTDQGSGHRFYSDIYPTPILLAELRFSEGVPNRIVRIPDRSARPRMLYQRQLALAHSIFQDIRPMLAAPDRQMSSTWAKSYARYLCRREPGCTGVTISLRMHRNPEPGHLIAAARGVVATLDLESDEFYDTTVLVGDFPCETP